MKMSLEEHLFGDRPKRILALDGGGIRGVISLEILSQIERKVGAPLSDTFDLIGGTSTGSIIAAGLALGWPVSRLKEFYLELGGTIFKRELLRQGLLRAKFPKEPLEQALLEAFGDIRLGGPELQTGLAIVAKRLDTHSAWVLHNNPRSRYYQRRDDGSAVPNKDYLVRQLVRASTAAPHYFDPERIPVSDDNLGFFVDGGVSPHNNPALQLLLLATLEGYGLRWPLGQNRLLVVSVGTGSWTTQSEEPSALYRTAGGNAFRSLVSMMDDACSLNELLLQWLSCSPTARAIDREVGDLAHDLLGPEPALSYLRYNAALDSDWMREQLPDHELSDEEVKQLRAMDVAENLAMLTEVGRAAAQSVHAEHFPAAFL